MNGPSSAVREREVPEVLLFYSDKVVAVVTKRDRENF